MRPSEDAVKEASHQLFEELRLIFGDDHDLFMTEVRRMSEECTDTLWHRLLEENLADSNDYERFLYR